jgi:hypothetical protein
MRRSGAVFSMITRGPALGRLGASALALTLALAVPSAARADEGDVAQAQALFGDGRAAMEKGDYVNACAKFSKSLALVRRAGTLVNLAQCEEKQGQLRSAAQHWKEGIDLLPAGDERLAASKDRADDLARRIPRLSAKLSGPAPAGTRASVDGADVALADLTAGVPLDPGKHTVVLVVPGSPEQRLAVDLAEGQREVVALALFATAPTKPDQPVSSGSSSMKTAGFALLGVGGAGVLVLGITGGLLVSRNSQINAACPVQGTAHVCSPHGQDLINGDVPLKIVNGIGWGAAIGGLGVGAALVAIGWKKTTVSPTVSPTGLPGGGGVWVTQRF